MVFFQDPGPRVYLRICSAQKLHFPSAVDFAESLTDNLGFWQYCNNCGAACKQSCGRCAQNTEPWLLSTDMSETSSDAESSCGWTIINNEGSDIETSGSEAVSESGAEPLERPALEEPASLESQTSVSAALCVEIKAADSLDDTSGEQAVDETLCDSEIGDGAGAREHVFSSSDHSDIVTSRDSKEDDHAEEEGAAAATEEHYLGTSSSSHYTFTATETAFPAQQPGATGSSSSEEEVERSSTPIVRRRRVRKNTTNVMTDPEDDEEVSPESRSSEVEEKEEQQQQADLSEVGPDPSSEDGEEGRDGSVFKKCISLVIIIAVSVGLHFCGTVEIQEMQKTVSKARGEEHMMDLRDLIQQHIKDQHVTKQRSDYSHDDLDEMEVIRLLSEVIENTKKENQELKAKQVDSQVQRDKSEKMSKQSEERTSLMSQQQSVRNENIQLRSASEREEKSLSVLKEESRNSRSKIRDLEARGAGADSSQSENQRSKEQSEEEQRMVRDLQAKREDWMVEARMSRGKSERERKVTEESRRESSVSRSHVSKSGQENDSEAEDLEKRSMESEKRSNFEQQRSDSWERLYVESKEEKAKGDREPKVKRAKPGMAGKVKETFDAVKNSTKEFVHHHKEQIKKAKAAVKENSKKFSDSVKSTFRHFKNSASRLISKAQGFYRKKYDKANADESWQPRPQKPQQRHASDSDSNTRKSAWKVLKDQDKGDQKRNRNGCTGVFDCAYQESMSLFNKAAEPIRADEFNLSSQSYSQQEVDHFYHWKESGTFISGFFHNGLFIHDRMLFTDFVSRVEDYSTDSDEYHGSDDDDVFGDLDKYIYRHFFGDCHAEGNGPRGPFHRPNTDPKEDWRARKQPRGRSRPHCARKWSRSGRNADRHMADVKIESGPMPFDPKY